MLIGFNAFGDFLVNDILPSKQTYTDSYFYGECVIDDVHLRDYEVTDSELLTISTEDEWDENSIYLFQFENNLEGGSLITGLTSPITQYIIRRRITGESLSQTIAELTYSETLNTFIDYYPKNNINYTYTVVPVFDDGVDKFEGQGIEGSDFVSFWGWTLSSIEDTPTVYKFDLELQSSSIECTQDVKLYENYTTYPAFRFGNMEYRKGKLTTIPYNYNETTGEYEIDITLLNNIKNFINDKNEKILRNALGESIKVITQDFSYKFNDKVADQIYSISFEFIEIGEVDV